MQNENCPLGDAGISGIRGDARNSGSQFEALRKSCKRARRRSEIACGLNASNLERLDATKRKSTTSSGRARNSGISSRLPELRASQAGLAKIEWTSREALDFRINENHSN